MKRYPMKSDISETNLPRISRMIAFVMPGG